jgi:NADH:ubiquinone oxidoreductase subunit C
MQVIKSTSVLLGICSLRNKRIKENRFEMFYKLFKIKVGNEIIIDVQSRLVFIGSIKSQELNRSLLYKTFF